jgi:hypothetical protein
VTTRTNRSDKGVADSVEIERVANDDLRPEPAKVFGPFVPADEGGDLPALLEKLSRSRAPVAPVVPVMRKRKSDILWTPTVLTPI